MEKKIQTDFIINQFPVKLKKTYFKILFLLPAIGQTFVFLAMPSIGKETLVHCNRKGQILYQHHFKHPVDSLGMVDLSKVIVLQPSTNQISIFDLLTHQRQSINFQFLFQESQQSQIITFSQTKYVCIVEYGRFNDNRFRLTYFEGSNILNNKQIGIYESSSDWSIDHIICKGQQKSMIIWYKQKNQDIVTVKSFHIQGTTPIFKEHSIQLIKGQEGTKNNQYAIIKLWRNPNNDYFFHVNSNKGYCHYIWNQGLSCARQIHIDFEPKYSQFLIDTFSIGDFSIFHTFYFHNGVAQQSPVCCLSNKSLTLQKKLQRRWICSYLIKFQFPSYQNNIYIENSYANADVSSFTMKIIKVKQEQI